MMDAKLKGDLVRIIQDDDAVESAKLTVQHAYTLAQRLVEGRLKASQIRNIFGKVRQIEMNWPPDDRVSEKAASQQRELILLEPRLKYQTKRVKAMEPLADVLIEAGRLVRNRADFQRYADFFEAVLAYHKSLGGEE